MNIFLIYSPGLKFMVTFVSFWMLLNGVDLCKFLFPVQAGQTSSTLLFWHLGTEELLNQMFDGNQTSFNTIEHIQRHSTSTAWPKNLNMFNSTVSNYFTLKYQIPLARPLGWFWPAFISGFISTWRSIFVTLWQSCTRVVKQRYRTNWNSWTFRYSGTV